MASRRLHVHACAILALVGAAAFAQAPATPARAGAQPVPLDRVLVVVNDEAVTQWDLNEQRRIVLSQLKASNIAPPPNDVLDKQVLERLIVERSLLQYAKETGIRVDDTRPGASARSCAWRRRTSSPPTNYARCSSARASPTPTIAKTSGGR